MEPKKDKIVAIAPKIMSDASDWLQQFFPTLNAGATFVLNAFPSFYQYSLNEMRGRFSRGELGMILDVLNGHDMVLSSYQISPSLIGHHLVLEIADSFRIYPGSYEKQWEIDDPRGFIERLKSLTMFQKICIELWAAAFWHNPETTVLDEHIRPLLSEKGTKNV